MAAPTRKQPSSSRLPRCRSLDRSRTWQLPVTWGVMVQTAEDDKKKFTADVNSHGRERPYIRRNRWVGFRDGVRIRRETPSSSRALGETSPSRQKPVDQKVWNLPFNKGGGVPVHRHHRDETGVTLRTAWDGALTSR